MPQEILSRSAGLRHQATEKIPKCAPNGALQDVPDQVGRIAYRIKDWRTAAGLSLQLLANRSDVSPSTIHKIENGQTVPTIAVLLKLAAGLGRRATDLLDDEEDESGSVHTRAGEGPALRTDRGAQIEWLMGDSLAPEIEIWRVTHPPGFSFGGNKIKHPSGEVVLMVESGCLEASIGNDRFVLNPGDTLHFKGTQPHSWKNVGDDPASVLLLGNVQAGARSGLIERMRQLRSRTHTPRAYPSTGLSAS
jgi:transcriptional regulator with XRE-family HTH domain